MRVKVLRRLSRHDVEREFGGTAGVGAIGRAVLDGMRVPVARGETVEVSPIVGRWLISAQLAEEMADGDGATEEAPAAPPVVVAPDGPLRVRFKRYVGRYSARELFTDEEMAVLRREVTFPVGVGKRRTVSAEAARLMVRAGAAELVVEEGADVEEGGHPRQEAP